MTLYQFRLLDEMEQMEAVWDAVHLMNRSDYIYQYELYQRDGFYIELKRHKEYYVLHGIRAFKSTLPLDDYLITDIGKSGAVQTSASTFSQDGQTDDDKSLELQKHLEQYLKARQRGKVLIWYILLPAALLFLAFQIWQYATGRL